MVIGCISTKAGGLGNRIRPTSVISPQPARKLLPPTLFSSGTISNPPRLRHRRRTKISYRFNRELGFRLLGLAIFGPPRLYWISLKIGCPSLPIAWPRSVSCNPSLRIVFLMVRHKAMIGRGHQLGHMSTSIQELFNISHTDLKLLQNKAINLRQFLNCTDKSPLLYDLEGPRCQDDLEFSPISADYLLNMML